MMSRLSRWWRLLARDQRGSISGEMSGMLILVSLGVGAATLAAAAAHTYTTLHQFAVASAAVNDSAFRFYRDARAAKAIDVLPTDVNGASNADGHEFEILYQNVDGTLQLARYTYTTATGSWQRCVQSTPDGACTPQGHPQSGLSVFHAGVVTMPEVADPTSTHYIPIFSTDPAHAPIDVELATQWAGMRAGNHAVEIRVANAKQDLTVDLAPGSAVTAGLTEISGTYTPPPPDTCSFVAAYNGSSSTGWTVQNGSSLWQWYETPPPCTNASTPPPATYVSAYAPACPAQFYTPQNSEVTWQQQPQPNATTPPPTSAVVGYDTAGNKIYQSFSWNEGPCPSPTQPPEQPTTNQNVCDVVGNANYNANAGQTIGSVTYVGVSSVPPCAAVVPTPCPTYFSGTAPSCTPGVVEQYSMQPDGVVSGAISFNATLFADGTTCDNYVQNCPPGYNIYAIPACGFSSPLYHAIIQNPNNGGITPYYAQQLDPLTNSDFDYTYQESAESGDGNVDTGDGYCTGWPGPP
jgi:hypothetical protein